MLQPLAESLWQNAVKSIKGEKGETIRKLLGSVQLHTPRIGPSELMDQATSKRRDESFRDCSVPFRELGRDGAGGGGFFGCVCSAGYRTCVRKCPDTVRLRSGPSCSPRCSAEVMASQLIACRANGATRSRIS